MSADTLRRYSAFLVALVVIVGLSTRASAQQTIGSAAVVRNDVTRSIAGKRGALSVGEAVVRDEIVKTGGASSTKLVFVDSTNLAIGPISRVVLDRFVFAGEQAASAVGVKLAQGLFRFTTGTLDKRAYTITTPTAVLGVRGTILDLRIDGSRRTRVTLVEGKVIVCPLGHGQSSDAVKRTCTDPEQASSDAQRDCGCVTLARRGQTASVATRDGIVRAELTLDSVSFASICTTAPGLCSASRYAQVGKRTGRTAQERSGAAPEPRVAQSGSPAAGLSTPGSDADAALCGR